MAHPRARRHSWFTAPRAFFSVAAVSIVFELVAPAPAGAGLVADFIAALKSATAQAQAAEHTGNLQAFELPKPAMNVDPSAGRGGGDITIVDDSALVPEEGPSGTIADIEKPKSATISIYVVQEGDTLSEIAEMFDVTSNTIKWANDIPPSGTIRIGQTLTILPVTGIKYTVKKGDTIASIAKKYGGDAQEIANFNELEGALAAGTEIIIPDGVAPATSAPKKGSSYAGSGGTLVQAGYYLRPVAGGKRTQGIHGYNGIDIGAAHGTPILASAAGEVIIAKGSGWNGGYGQYVVIRHDNGTQTLYAHASSVIVGAGQTVQQGQVIAYMGSTGKSTGTHLHFEVRGAKNPF